MLAGFGSVREVSLNFDPPQMVSDLHTFLLDKRGVLADKIGWNLGKKDGEKRGKGREKGTDLFNSFRRRKNNL